MHLQPMKHFRLVLDDTRHDGRRNMLMGMTLKRYQTCRRQTQRTKMRPGRKGWRFMLTWQSTLQTQLDWCQKFATTNFLQLLRYIILSSVTACSLFTLAPQCPSFAKYTDIPCSMVDNYCLKTTVISYNYCWAVSRQKWPLDAVLCQSEPGLSAAGEVGASDVLWSWLDYVCSGLQRSVPLVRSLHHAHTHTHTYQGDGCGKYSHHCALLL